MKILCLDIGSGTQDVVVYDPHMVIENCVKFVLPSPAVRTAERIRKLTERGKALYLYGSNMGGGFGDAVREHLKAGYAVAAHPAAAAAMADDPDRVRGMGVKITDACPRNHAPVHLTDYDPGLWNSLLTLAGEEYPDIILAAVQDHGLHPKESNRIGRFKLLRRILEEHGGAPEMLLFETPPPEMTRLQTLKEAIGAGAVADTGAAAVLGALFDPDVEAENMRRGITVVNVGNSHTIAFLLFRNRILGVYEHHTGMLTREMLLADLKDFAGNCKSNEQVLEEGGHGCALFDIPARAGDFSPLYVLGPRRGILAGAGVFPAPGGDMMTAGCFGLIKGAQMRRPPLIPVG